MFEIATGCRALDAEHVFRYTLNARQQEILDFLVRHHRDTGLVASVREIQSRFEFSSSNAVASHLRALERKGYLVRRPGKTRSLTFPVPPNSSRDGATFRFSANQIQDDGRQAEMEAINGPASAAASNQAPVRRGAPAPELARIVEAFPNGSLELDDRTRLVQGDALDLLQRLPRNSIHAVVTDPPYGLIEYEDEHHAKLRTGKGGVWRIPPKFDGAERSPLPRFTVLTAKDLERLGEFFRRFGELVLRVLVPGGHLIIASNPLLSTLSFGALASSGLEKRGELIRLVTTLRGGDRPKGAEAEFPDVSVMPRSGWEPWGLFRKPIEASTVSENLRRWKAGGFRRTSADEPFKDVIECPPARGAERELARHPSLKPQRLMRHLVRASLPLGEGLILDPFAGSGSTLAAAGSLGLSSIGFERDPQYCQLAKRAFAGLKAICP